MKQFTRFPSYNIITEKYFQRWNNHTCGSENHVSFHVIVAQVLLDIG